MSKCAYASLDGEKVLATKISQSTAAPTMCHASIVPQAFHSLFQTLCEEAPDANVALRACADLFSGGSISASE